MLIIQHKTINGVESFAALTRRQYNLTVNDDTLRWFRRLGGAEIAQRSYTANGYCVHRLISRSPDRKIKVVRNFKFIVFDYYEQKIFDSIYKGIDEKSGLFALKRFKRLLTLKELKDVISNKVKLSKIK